MIKNFTPRLCGFVLLSLFSLVLRHPVVAGGVRDIALTSVAAARNPITVDGSLAEWPDTHPATFAPLDPGLVTPATPAQAAAVARLHRQPVSASLQACYDSKALYLGIVWKGVPRDAGILTLHVQTDRIVHIRLIPAAGKQTIVQERIGDAADWHTLSSAAQCATVARPDRTATQEVCIPWQALTESGAPPAALTLAADLEWPQLTAAFLRQLPPGVRHDNTHLTDCFLTAPDKLFGRDAYLGNSNDWGTLHFVAGPHANATQVSAMSNGATETYVAHVAAPLPVTGSLAGWNPAQFQTAAYAPGLLGDRYSAKIAASYDADFLYIAAHVKALGGPLNTQPEATQAGYAGGDCLQVRLNDGQHTVNLCAWYDSTNKKPALTADGNDLKNPYLLKQGAKEAFQADADGQGYTQVMAVPWRVLPGGGAPHDGDTWKGTFQVWWAGLNPQFTALASPTLAAGGGIAYSYTLPAEANVTLGVFDAQGHLVRFLVKDAHRRAGRNTDYWDGKDQFGALVAAGRYAVRGISHPPIGVEPVVSIGNPGSPPWPTVDGTGDWLSDEAAPQGAVTDGTNVYLASPGCEKGSAVIAVGPDGKRTWGYNVSIYTRCVSLALAGKYLFALFSGPVNTHTATGGPSKIERAFIICLDKATGAPALFSTQKPAFQIVTWPYVDQVGGLWDLRTHKGFTPTTYEGQPRYFANDVGEPTEAVGIAAVGGKLYVSMLTQNQVLVLDGTTGQQIDTLPLPQPVGLHALANGKILGVSAGKVVVIDPATKGVTTVIDRDLVAPHDVTTDKAGNIYVSDWGTSFQVKVFTPQGRLLRAIGTPGGRPWIGKWDANGMLLPRGMAVTDDGKLWVAEDDASPNRVSVWDAATGSFIRDYIGPSPYGGGSLFWADPTDPSTVTAEGVLYHVDYARKTWTPVATPFRRMSWGAAFTPNGMKGGTPGNRTIVHNGKQYVFYTDDPYGMIILRRDGNLLTPVGAVGSIGRLRTSDSRNVRIWDSEIGTHEVKNYYPDFFGGHVGDNYIWSDKNGDGQVQADEMQWAHSLGRGDTYAPGQTPEIFADWGFGVGPDGAIYVGGQTKGSNVISRLDLQGWSASGAPLYDLTTIRPLVLGVYAHGLYVNDANQLFVTSGYEYSPPKHHALDVYDRNGNLLWTFNAAEGRQQEDDFLADNVIGEFHEPGGETILASWLWHANFKPYLFTSDGLYVSSLLEDSRLGPTAAWDESYKNYYQGPDGAAYIVNGANDTYHINKIIGLDQIHRFSGSLTVSQADLNAAVAAASAKAAAPPPVPKPVIHVAWMQAPPTVDGDLSEWDMGAGVALTGSRNRSARVALGRDANNLYLAYDVHGAKLVNRGGNVQTLFISGDCDDLMLHAGQYSPHFAPAEGDERLLLSVYQGQPVAVLYRPVVPGSTSSTRLMAATIDQIVRLSSAKIAYKRTGDGYTLEASVPLSDLGVGEIPSDPVVGTTLRGDVGVIYADETGADRSLRLYYYNQNTNMTADLTTEATLQPGNWGDVEFPLGLNLLKNGDFEQPLASTPDQGWAITATRNGGSGVISGDGYTGGHSLLLQQTVPVVFASDSYTLPDYGEFIKSANAGKGGGYTEVRQRVAVVGGHKYALRFHLRTLDFQGGENRKLGPNRGYDSLGTGVQWLGSGGGEHVTNYQDTTPEWKTFTDARFNYYAPSKPYTAPAGATSAIIQFGLVANAAQHLPKAYIDDVEFIELP